MGLLAALLGGCYGSGGDEGTAPPAASVIPKAAVDARGAADVPVPGAGTVPLPEEPAPFPSDPLEDPFAPSEPPPPPVPTATEL